MPTVDEREPGFIVGPVMQQQAIAFASAEDLKAENIAGHGVSPH
jgi:hypothetical protein